MRAHERKKTARATGTAAVLTLIKARLWWLVGYPDKSQWVSVPPRGRRGVETIDIDGTLIRRAAYGLRKLRGEFPKALPRVVGDADAWVAGAGAILAALKPVAHRKESAIAGLLRQGLFSKSTEKAIAALPPKRRAIAERLSWVYATRPKDLLKAVRWLEEVDRVPSEPLVQTRLAHLAAAHGASRVTGITALLSDSRTATTPLSGAKQILEPAIKAMGVGTAPPAARQPKPILARELEAFMTRLPRLDSSSERRALALLDAAELFDLVGAWSAWWSSAHKHIQRAVNIDKSFDERLVRIKRMLAVREGLVAQKKLHPPEVRVDYFLRSLLSLATNARLTREVLRLAAIFPDGTGNSAAVLRLIGEHALFPKNDKVDRVLPTVVSNLRLLLRANVKLKHTWLDLGRSQLRNPYDVDSVESRVIDDFPAKRIPAVYDALAELATDCADNDSKNDFISLATTVADIFEAIKNADNGAPLARALFNAKMHTRWIRESTFAGIERVCEPDAFEGIAPEIVRLAESVNEIPLSALLDVVLPALGGDRRALHFELLGGDLSLLANASRKLALLKQLKTTHRVAPPKAASDQRWLEAYPAALAGPLTLLARSEDDPAAVADKLIGSFARSRSALEKELAAIGGRLATEELDATQRTRLESRAANLTERLDSPIELSDKQINKVTAKIYRRAARKLLEDADANASVALEAALLDLLGLETAPDWLGDDRVRRVLLGALPEAGSRVLAIQLLRARAGPKPWDLRDEPQNSDFIASMKRRGLELTPWLDGAMTSSHGRGKDAFTIEIEDDPIEIFYMGQHFGTCLSIEQCNFFSVFSNAADINKRVLYARNSKGQVVGRRLVCIGDSGALIAFRPYAHEGASAFPTESDKFIGDLAAAMNTVTAPRGHISTLVAKNWYDDGSFDVANRFEFLNERSEFRVSLLTLEPGELAGAIEKTIGQPRIDGILAPVLAALPEFSERPHLAAELVGLLKEPERLPGDVALGLAMTLDRRGLTELARDTFAETIEKHLLDMHRQRQWMPSDGLNFIARIRPSRALRILRATRGRGVRTWADERDENRIVAAAVATFVLGRRKKGAEIEALLSSKWAKQTLAATLAEWIGEDAR